MTTTTILDLPEVRARVHRWTVQDYIEMAEENPAFRHSELIRGLIVEKMSKSSLHIALTKKSYDFLLRRVREGLPVVQEGSLRLADSMPEPDVAGVRGTMEDIEHRHATTAELLIEVAVSSVALDRENASLYAEAGVAEYWIILAEAEAIEAYRRPVEGVYQERRTYRRGETIPCVCVEGGAVPVETWFS